MEYTYGEAGGYISGSVTGCGIGDGCGGSGGGGYGYGTSCGEGIAINYASGHKVCYAKGEASEGSGGFE